MKKIIDIISEYALGLMEDVKDFYVFRLLLSNDKEYRQMSNELNNLFNSDE